jgi:dinuclear metal center YbgI/SA1388 family protein
MLQEIVRYLQQIAPLTLAEDWDNVGLLLGDDSIDVVRAITCLTLTPDVADEAVTVGARLIVTHHPVLFKPVKRLTASSSEGRMLLKLMRHGIAVYSPHTAYDNAATGINQQLAELLELTDIAPLRPRAGGDQFKLVTFVPEGQLDAVRRGIWNAGAGVIGNYRFSERMMPILRSVRRDDWNRSTKSASKSSARPDGSIKPSQDYEPCIRTKNRRSMSSR